MYILINIDDLDFPSIVTLRSGNPIIFQTEGEAADYANAACEYEYVIVKIN
jgi:hypothetical protein